MNDLFDDTKELENPERIFEPLAEKLRPSKLSQVIGQEGLLGPQGSLTKTLAGNSFQSIIFWGPPGVCLLYTSPSPRDVEESRMPSSA